MTRKSSLAAAGLLLVLGAAPAGAGLVLERLGWQLSFKEKGRPPRKAEVKEIQLSPGTPMKGRLAAKLTVKNEGAARQGILIRYALAARFGKDWALPFMLQEKRVPTVKADATLEVALDPTDLLRLYLGRVNREGHWPEELKIQVMLEPRKGEPMPLKTIEGVLPIRR